MTASEPDRHEAAAEGWLHNEAAAAYDALKADPSRAIPVEDVRAPRSEMGRPFVTGTGAWG
jgi:hypothetical protein